MWKKHAVVFLLAFPVLSLASCGGGEPERIEARQAALPVAVEAAEMAPVGDFSEAVGTVRARASSALSSKIMGQVLSVSVQPGQFVKQGQLLAEIDSRDAAANLTRSKAGLSEAQNALVEAEESVRAAEAGTTAAEAAASLAASTYARYRALLERDSVSRQEFEEVEFRKKAADAEAIRAQQGVLSAQARRRQALDKIDQANAELRNAETFVSYSRITAPFSGVIAAKQVDPGALATPGMPLLTIEESGACQLEATVEESAINRIHIGDRAAVLIDALAAKEIAGVVAEIALAGDPSSRSFMVKLRLPPIDGLRSGMFGRARFAAGHTERLSVPAQAVFERGQLVGVMVVDPSARARFRLVKTGKQFGNRVEVLSGLAPGERVISEAPGRVPDGTLVAPRSTRREGLGISN